MLQHTGITPSPWYYYIDNNYHHDFENSLITGFVAYLGALWTRFWLIRFVFCPNLQNPIVWIKLLIFWLDFFLSSHVKQSWLSSLICFHLSPPPYCLLPPSLILTFPPSLCMSLLSYLTFSLLFTRVLRCKPNTLITAVAEIDVTRFKFPPVLSCSVSPPHPHPLFQYPTLSLTSSHSLSGRWAILKRAKWFHSAG